MLLYHLDDLLSTVDGCTKNRYKVVRVHVARLLPTPYRTENLVSGTFLRYITIFRTLSFVYSQIGISLLTEGAYTPNKSFFSLDHSA